MAIRPDPKNPAPSTGVGGGAAIKPDGIPPFDAAGHFADYDHEAVKELSRKTLITPATYNRKGTAELCVGATNRHKLEAKLYIHDDGSDEYDEIWLAQFADRVYRHDRSRGGKQGVKNLRSNITKSVLGDFKPEIFKPWLEEDFGTEGPEYLYHVDSDGYHDPHFFYRIHEIMQKYPNWGSICLYNAKFHTPRGRRSERTVVDAHTVVREASPGISMFLRVKSFRDNPNNVQVPDGRGWDGYYSIEVAGRKVVTSLVSYVEHYGKWGFHNKGNFDRDKSINPTRHLVETRKETIARIEEEHVRTQNHMSKIQGK